jgi:NADH-quinone oxidoreductase subunit L
LLFLGSGAVIHALAGEQDLRRMGGLRRELPITYWTFLIGALAIAGFPFLSGFFSKDEILFRTFESGHHVLWIVAIVTSFLTAVYMFRLVFLAFHGERRTAHAHLHDAPPSMAIPLIVLAIGSILAGYVGVPHALGGSNRIESFLEPSFGIHHEAAPKPDATSEADATGEHGAPNELAFMTVSTVVALGGIAVAALLFLRRRDMADSVARSFQGVHHLLLNKYYVDELYDAAVVQPIKRVSTTVLWRGVDAGLIDGTVNGVGTIVRSSSAVLRQLQTGSVRAYAASLFFGVVVIVGYYLWR